ncbi:hypothetical protein KK060_14290 [Fulvivirgaceae bacterium PWU20]|uniref:Uncharacterized protein n=1 Tax=Chryseosolibacter indicus TaxID=2782351 RepID=A0ABS5VSP5_9BACT|nr:hypothetical protein [Chryseosolibacter indicus]MBT1704460.1 hypothetical protein [Chryseosolibacter indicus]
MNIVISESEAYNPLNRVRSIINKQLIKSSMTGTAQAIGTATRVSIGDLLIWTTNELTNCSIHEE